MRKLNIMVVYFIFLCSKTREFWFFSDPNLCIIVDNAPNYSCVGDKDCSLIQIAISKAVVFSFLFFLTLLFTVRLLTLVFFNHS